MTSFNELGLSELGLAAVDALGYNEPTPVQQQAIPAILQGRDVIAAAKTGTGKTAAFSLPSMDKIGHARHGQGPLMLVITPTRELAMQIREVCTTIATKTHHHVTCVVGGLSYGPQIDALSRGTDVLIATPGRLVDLINQGAADLSQVETVVLDEADRMLDMGFLPDMKRIIKQCPVDRQTLLFSATIDSAIQKNMKNLLKDPVFVEIAHKGETADTIEQYVIHVDQRAKIDLLISLLNERGGTRIIVFARTRHRVDNTVKKLRRAGFKCAPIHSDRSQNQRKRALDDFAAGKIDIIVATDVLARGIDVSDVYYVVNLDMPMQAEDYVHRIGRTGRAGEKGFAVSFISPDTKKLLRAVEKLIGISIPTMEVKSFDASASEAALADKATRKAAKEDPELAAAAKEDKSRKKSKAKRERKRNEEAPSPHKTRGTAKKQGKKNQKAAQAAQKNGHKSAEEPARKKNRNAAPKGRNGKGDFRSGKPQAKGSKNDFRPGRAQRRTRAKQHSKSAR
ncbi:DEAD/DEAH box helicase [Denitrobacterium detoxificans]|uniref:DEAD/DEAH box helicase n=1 Tax=Denitrobacterium detoxificans TaxID=79604 RepID=UPI0007C9D19F|nr:DEAD/DEAH box helicase [Denitrobacterium detoxificans]ANE22496.1 DEAD/DEAH box helicase [Denitrobacterium detoxificans]